jgi:hypothetical protein
MFRPLLDDHRVETILRSVAVYSFNYGRMNASFPPDDGQLFIETYNETDCVLRNGVRVVV